MNADEPMDPQISWLLREYREMSQDIEHEAEALEWAEVLIADAVDEQPR